MVACAILSAGPSAMDIIPRRCVIWVMSVLPIVYGGWSCPPLGPIVDTVIYRGDILNFVHGETGSVWDPAGRAASGPQAGTQLEWLNTSRAYWFSIAIALPRVQVYRP